jgi:hypothetical protein
MVVRPGVLIEAVASKVESFGWFRTKVVIVDKITGTATITAHRMTIRLASTFAPGHDWVLSKQSPRRRLASISCAGAAENMLARKTMNKAQETATQILLRNAKGVQSML